MLRIAGLGLVMVLGFGGVAIAGTPGDGTWSPCPPGVSKCPLGGNSGGAHEDPPMDGHEGVPPNSQGSGTRMTEEEGEYWRLINGGKSANTVIRMYTYATRTDSFTLDRTFRGANAEADAKKRKYQHNLRSVSVLCKYGDSEELVACPD